MRKALIVGIDYYDRLRHLTGCVNDARAVHDILNENANGKKNFVQPALRTCSSKHDAIDRGELKREVRDLFDCGDEIEIALFYFAGHGYVEDVGGFLCTSECQSGDEGFALSELMTIAGKSGARNKLIVLDSCHSGAIADRPDDTKVAEVKQGMTLLTASGANQYAMEGPGGGGGVFTTLFVDALAGAGADLLGHVTPGSIYAHIDQSLGPRAQRPVFKTNVKSFVSLREAEEAISLRSLKRLTKIFREAEPELRLDPSFEPERSAEQLQDPSIPPPNPVNTEIFAVLQEYAKVNLVRPVGTKHMWNAAMEWKSCELTVLGRHYWRLVRQGLL